MRLTAELIGSSEQRTNPLGEREIILRGLAIPVIEHMGVTRDAFDAMDLTDNRLSRLENFPRLLRLCSLSLSGNVIETIDANNMSKNVPNLKYMDLSYNHISTLLEVSNLGKAYSTTTDDKSSDNKSNDNNKSKGALEILSLVGNPVQSEFKTNNSLRRRRRRYYIITIIII
ncbi:MAG: hypothetical protein ACI8RD_010189 [Bacillariaceae sp.]|jgi:hypothetical protein